jgi:flagellar hook-associated protein 2
VNGGATRTSTSNTLDAAAHGIAGLSVTVANESTQTVQVAVDTASMRTKVEAFIARFNEVQAFLDGATKISSDNKGKVTAAILADNREIQSWGHSLRSMAFSAVAGITGSITRLDHLGIDFKAGTSELEIKDGAKLDAALRDKSADVDAFFHTTTTGFGAKFEKFLTAIDDLADKQQKALIKSNQSLDEQIAAIERRLEQRRAVMESAFILMEQAQSNLKNQQSALDRNFPAKGSS